MSKKVVLVVSLIFIVIGSGILYLLITPNKQTHHSPTDSNFSTSQEKQCENCDQQPGTYVAYSENIIKQTAGTKVLFFHAPWCPQCRELEASIQAGTIPSGVTIIKVDYDSNQALRQKYGVTIQTTLVRVSDTGELEKKFVAYDEPSLAAIIKNLL